MGHITKAAKYKGDTGREYVIGLSREYPHPPRSHLYDGTHDNPGNPMCRFGWNRLDGAAYSIWRGNVGHKGICKHCLNRANKGLDGVDARESTVRVHNHSE